MVVVFGLLVAFASRADAAAYYVGGGKGVRLAVRVVDRQIAPVVGSGQPAAR